MQVRILLIVGDPTVGKHLAALVAGRGYECSVVPSLAEAGRELRERAYALVILDLDLLGDDPVPTARQFRRAHPTVRLVGLDSLAEHRARGGDSPFDAVIPKPFLIDPLLAALPTLIPAAG